VSDQERYTPERVKAAVEADIDRLFAPWLIGRPENYRPDPGTKALVALGYWLDEELRRLGCDDLDRKTQCWKYNRHSRTYDIWETAAECCNDVLDGKVERDRKPHRRWG
jgi:hypothetical protein